MLGPSLAQIQPPGVTRLLGSETQAGPPVPAVPLVALPPAPVVLPPPLVPAPPEVFPPPLVPAVPEVFPPPLVPAVPVSAGLGDAQPQTSRQPARQETTETDERMGASLSHTQAKQPEEGSTAARAHGCQPPRRDAARRR